ncbi:MAG: hypothetical protein U5K28_05270 [Halobacteriales archaeon]|nr:hypothetical protein [Halobacteriales archaeon]
MTDDHRSTTVLLAHARYRREPSAGTLRTRLARSTLVERRGVARRRGRSTCDTPRNPRAGPPRPTCAADTTARRSRRTPSTPNRPPSRFDPVGDINPVLTAADVTDFGRTDCVADPFLFVTDDGDWHMFFEVYTHNRDPTAAIAHAESDDGYDWTYDRVVLETDEHLSYPYVFRWEGEHYMVPDRWAKERGPAPVTLYRADSFPTSGRLVATSSQPATPLHDFSPFRWEGRWWALVGDGTDLYAYYSDDLEAPDWTPHEANPVVEGRPTAARPGGRPLVFDDRVLAFYQDCSGRYGERIHAYEITELTPSTLRRTASGPTRRASNPPGGLGWNSGAMHQVDPWFDGEGWHCAVDGNLGLGYQLLGEHHWAIGIYRA